MDTLKAKLKEKTEEVEKLEKSNQMLKEIIQRNEKEKSSLQSKIKRYAIFPFFFLKECPLCICSHVLLQNFSV